MCRSGDGEVVDSGRQQRVQKGPVTNKRQHLVKTAVMQREKGSSSPFPKQKPYCPSVVKISQ